jgi:hypothetical protein
LGRCAKNFTGSRTSSRSAIKITSDKTPQQFEKTYKRKGAGSTQKMSETEEEKSTKRQKTKEHEENKDQILQDESEPLITKPTVVVEVLSSTNLQSSGNQNGKETLETDQSKQVDHFHQFMEIKKKGVKIKQDIFLKSMIKGHLRQDCYLLWIMKRES